VEAQVIVHPGCVWGVSPLVGSSDFVTACHDGRIRVFTRRPSRAAPDSVRSSFHKAAEESRAARSSGPSPEEITKLPAWETNALVRGKSEGQVQVFRRDGRAIAAQWSAASGTWIEVGEVTGTNANAGTLDGRRYDHVLPIEIDVPGGGVRTLRIGYNDGENPFVTAQAFIDEHALDQGYLAQIADYIRQRAGETGPTLGAGGGGGAPVPPSAPAFAGGTPAFDHLPMRGYKIFDAGVDKNGLGKVLSKIREFNDDVPTDQKLVPSEANDLLNTLSTTLSVTNRYHASTISDAELAIIHKMITRWDAKHAFPALDLARATALHPDATGPKRRVYWEEVLRGALDLCLGLGDRLVEEVAVPMLSMRLIANSYKGGSGSADAAGGMIDR
jgi:phospholipase A-2-activating protein